MSTMISVTVQASMYSRARVDRLITPAENPHMIRVIGRASQIQSAPFHQPMSLSTPARKYPEAAAEAGTNTKYMRDMAQPENTPSRGPSDAPTKPYTDPAWLYLRVSSMYP